jgi:precorrin isomerase
LSNTNEKARRGELVVAAPVGFVKVGDRLEKDPDRRVQEAITLAGRQGTLTQQIELILVEASLQPQQ